MSETAPAAASDAEGSAARPADSKEARKSASKAARKGESRGGLFARIALFVRQVIGELKKVVAPTRKELINYTLVVLVFVTIMMVIVTLLDLAFGTAVSWVFGGSGPTDS